MTKLASFIMSEGLSQKMGTLGIGGTHYVLKGTGDKGPAATEEMLTAKEKLKEAEKLISELNMTWEQKLKKTQEIQKERYVCTSYVYTICILVVL